MYHRHHRIAALLILSAATPVLAQGTPIALTYNFNGIIHAGEAGLPDDIAGFRSISDRALDFSAGVPSDALLDRYQIVGVPGALDIVHLGNRNTVDNGNWAFDLVADFDGIGVQPSWLPVVDQTGPQISVITPQPVFANTTASFIYQISNGGGSFDVTLRFASGASLTETLSGPDWFLGPYTATGSVDGALPDQNLSITEGTIELGAFAGDQVTQVEFSNQSNAIGGYAIIAGTFENRARHTVIGSGCYPIDERGGWHQEFADAASAEIALDNQALLYVPNGGGYTTVVGAGVFRPGNPASLLSLTDDQEVALFLPGSFNYRGATPVGVVYLSANGVLSMGPGNGGIIDLDAAFFTSAGDGAFVAYGEDLDPDGGAAGTISTEYDAATDTYYITFEAVPHFPGDPVANGTATFQYQLELTSGLCTIVYGDMTPGTTPQTDGVLIGETAPVAVADTAIDIFALGTFTTFATETIVSGVELTADVPAVSTAATGTVVTYSVANAPDFSPTVLPGVKVGLLVGSTAALAPLPGIDLAFLSAPGCPLFVSTLDFLGTFDPFGNIAIGYPAGVPPQTVLNFQAAMLFDISDPAYPSTSAGLNGNLFAQTSNALVTVLSDQ